ncbi:hypothetical protein CPter91_5058 [Collimonas pratensis]|uniref:Uncharacterized protein n=1 Tax=Collimonas pratensis TaxID=279113 RepID=A0A127QBH0_9BURK|nr:hypothetical protein CPter91_5058 [Collimonas pratensis]
MYRTASFDKNLAACRPGDGGVVAIGMSCGVIFVEAGECALPFDPTRPVFII